jgi:hypothetical protein
LIFFSHRPAIGRACGIASGSAEAGRLLPPVRDRRRLDLDHPRRHFSGRDFPQ